MSLDELQDSIQSAFDAFFQADPAARKGLTPLGWFAGGFITGEQKALQDLREAVRAALEAHYEAPNPHTTEPGHMAAGYYADGCVVCDLQQAAAARRREIHETAAQQERRIREEAFNATGHVYRDLKP